MQKDARTGSVIRSICAVGRHGRHTVMNAGMSWSVSILYGKRKMRYGRRA